MQAGTCSWRDKLIIIRYVWLQIFADTRVILKVFQKGNLLLFYFSKSSLWKWYFQQLLAKFVVLISTKLKKELSKNLKNLVIVCNGVPAPPPFSRHPSLGPTCPPFFKYFCLLSSVLFLLKYFRQSSPPSHKSLLPKSDQPTFLGLNKY